MKTFKIIATVVFLVLGIGLLVVTGKLPEDTQPIGYFVTAIAGIGLIIAGGATTREMLKGNFR